MYGNDEHCLKGSKQEHDTKVFPLDELGRPKFWRQHFGMPDATDRAQGIEHVLNTVSIDGEMTLGNKEIARVYPNWVKPRSQTTADSVEVERSEVRPVDCEAAQRAVRDFCR
jgi:hypothetical protein